MSEPSAGQVAFAERWLYLDIREAFPELPAEMVSEIAARCAPSTAAALNAALVTHALAHPAP